MEQWTVKYVGSRYNTELGWGYSLTGMTEFWKTWSELVNDAKKNHWILYPTVF